MRSPHEYSGTKSKNKKANIVLTKNAGFQDLLALLRTSNPRLSRSSLFMRIPFSLKSKWCAYG